MLRAAKAGRCGPADGRAMFDPDPPCVNRQGLFQSTIRFLRRQRGALPWARRAVDWLAPPRCVACGQCADLGSIDLCECCAEVLPWTPGALAPFRYEDPVGSGLRALKYGGDRRPARVFGALLAAHLIVHGPPQALVPVPLHPRRQLERGYNQAELLAREAACWLRVPVLARVVFRDRHTAPQARLPATDRRANVEHAFAAAPGAARRMARQGIRHVAVIDDVYTTGATIRSVGTVLQLFGLDRVDWRTVAVARPSENLTLDDGLSDRPAA